MVKKPLNLLVDEDLVKKARNHGLVISRFLENKLIEYFSFIDAVSRSSTPDIRQYQNLNSVSGNEADNNSNSKNGLEKVDLSGFEPEASSMPRRRSSELIYKP